MCSLFDVRIISVYIYMLPRDIFIRKMAISKPLTDLHRYLLTDFLNVSPLLSHPLPSHPSPSNKAGRAFTVNLRPLNRQLSELSYLLQRFNLFICHLASLPIRHFGKLVLWKTSENYFRKHRKTTSENYFGELRKTLENSTTKTPQAEAFGQKLLRPKASGKLPPVLAPPPSNKVGWAYRSKLLRDNFYEKQLL